MNRNFYLNIIATILVMAVILLGVILINAVDRVHFDYMDVQKKLSEMNDSLQQLKNKGITAMQSANTVPAANAAVDAKTAATEKSPEKIANLEFYDQNAVPGDRIITSISADVGNMNPLINNDYTVSLINGFCNSALADRNFEKPEIFEPLMAESWTISPDKKVYSIKLRKGIAWQDF